MEGCKIEEKKEKKEMKEEKEKKEKKEMNEEKEKLEKKVDEEEKLSFVPLEMLVNNHFFKEKEEKEGEEDLKDMFLDVVFLSVALDKFKDRLNKIGE